MSVTINIDMEHPELGKGHATIEAEGYPSDVFVPMALSKLGKDDARMSQLFQQTLSSELAYEEGDDESEDENR